MTDTMKTEQRREAFEQEMTERFPGLSLLRHDGDYLDVSAYIAFATWCAALDSQAAQAPQTPSKEEALQAVAYLVEAAGVDRSESADVLRRFISFSKEAAQAQPSGWTNVEDRLPPIDGETVFIGINTAGYACCFNNIESTSVIACFYDTAENSECLMSSLLWWRVLDRPASPSHSKEPNDER